MCTERSAAAGGDVHMARMTAILCVVMALAACKTPPEQPIPAPPLQSRPDHDRLTERVDVLIADLRAREAADVGRPAPSANREKATTQGAVPQRVVTLAGTQAPAVPRSSPAVAIKSSLDEMRERAANAFEARIADLHRQFAGLQRRRHEAGAACSGTTSGTSLGAVIGPVDQTPVTIPVPNANVSLTMGNIEIANETTPQCRAMRAAVEADDAAIKAALDALDTEARRAGIYPGVMRELFAKYEIR